MWKQLLIGMAAVLTAWTFAAFPPSALAAPPVEEIVHKANLAAYYQGDDGRSHVNMTITDSQGRERTRRFIILRKDIEEGGQQKFYVHFSRPADVRDTVFMVWKHIGRDDDRWLYLPALDLVKRIAASDKRTSFVGSHFFYEDVSGRNPEEDTHELIETTDKYFVLKNTPKDAGNVEFAWYNIWVDKTTYLPVKAEYYDSSGARYRVVEALEVKTIQGHPTVTRARVQDLKSGGNTISEFSNIEYDLGIEESIFSERFLRRAPRRWLR